MTMIARERIKIIRHPRASCWLGSLHCRSSSSMCNSSGVTLLRYYSSVETDRQLGHRLCLGRDMAVKVRTASYFSVSWPYFVLSVLSRLCFALAVYIDAHHVLNYSIIACMWWWIKLLPSPWSDLWHLVMTRWQLRTQAMGLVLCWVHSFDIILSPGRSGTVVVCYYAFRWYYENSLCNA